MENSNDLRIKRFHCASQVSSRCGTEADKTRTSRKRSPQDVQRIALYAADAQYANKVIVYIDHIVSHTNTLEWYGKVPMWLAKLMLQSASMNLKRMRCLSNVDNASKADGRRAIQIVDISSLTRRRRRDQKTDYAIVRRIRHRNVADAGKVSTDN